VKSQSDKKVSNRAAQKNFSPKNLHQISEHGLAIDSKFYDIDNQKAIVCWWSDLVI